MVEEKEGVGRANNSLRTARGLTYLRARTLLLHLGAQ